MTPEQMYDKGREYYNNGEHEKGFEWFLKSAEQGYAKAQYEVGQWYEDILIETPNFGKAMEWYLKAAEQGHYGAISSLAFNYYYGRYKRNAFELEDFVPSDTIHVNYEEAFKWLSRLIEMEDKEISHYLSTLTKLANCYAKGLGVEKNEEKAVKLFTEIVDRNSQTVETWYYKMVLEAYNAGTAFDEAIRAADEKDKTLIKHYITPFPYGETIIKVEDPGTTVEEE